VLASGGQLGGFTGGTDLKLLLLAAEGVTLDSPQ
jgi:O6-methylguanine-DNA--protein-cysteine methyltransferase